MSGKRRFGKQLMSMALAIALTLSCVPVDSYATESEVQDETVLDEVAEELEEEILEETEMQTYIPDVELPSNEELFAAYVEQKMYGNEFSFWGVAAGERLTESGRQFYNKLKAEIEKIASGEEESTIMSIDAATLNSWNVDTTIVAADSNQALEILKERLDLDHVFSALLCDCPYDLYWFDKTVGFLYGASTSETPIAESSDKNYAVGSFTCGLSVAAAYRPSSYDANNPTVDKAKTGATSAAVTNAQAVVTEHAGKTDYEKLIAYRDYICEKTQYNHSAAAPEYEGGYGDPWQLIYVFDNNDNTAVVCEGYSKAFQYLCDLSTFDNSAIACYIATGYMSGGTGEGPHMWNIVTMEDNKNYLVDITNSDQGTVGQNGDLFLAGGTALSSNSSDPLSGYRFMAGNSPIDYYYDNDLIWDSSVLSIASADYVPKMQYIVRVNVENLTFNGNATAVEGENYTAALTAAQGYVLPTEIEITVGENKLQAEQDYTYENGTITIPAEKITGAIVITAAGKTCPHSNYTYAGSDAVITVICAGCGKEVGTVTISAQQNLVYDGSAKAAAVTQSVDGLFAGTPVYEQKNGDTWISLDNAPTEVGTYKASITLGDATASVEFTIAAKAFEGINVTPGKGTWTNVVGMKTPLFSISADDYSKIAAGMELYVSTDDGTNWQKVKLEQSGSTYQSTKTLQDVLGNSVGNVNFKVKLTADNYADWVSDNYTAKLSPLVLSENNASLTLEGLQNGGVYYTGNEQTPKASLNVTKDGDSVYSISSDKANQPVTFTYANNAEIGTATVTVTGNGSQITGNVSVQFKIKYYDAEAEATVSSKTWAKSVAVNAPSNFTISQEINGIYAESFTVSQQSDTPAGTEVTYYLKENETGYITDAKKVTVCIDISAPQFEGEGFGIKITDRDAWWQELLTTVSFKLYKPQQVTINAKDNLSGVDSYYYYFDKSGSETTKTAAELKNYSFEKVTSPEFGMNSDGRYVIYAYAVDNAGNQSNYISSDGIIIDATEPEISLTEDNNTVVDETCEKAVLFGANEAVTYFYAIEMNYPSQPIYKTLGDLAYMNGDRWNAKEGVTEGKLTEAGTKGIVLKELTPNTNYRLSLGAVDSAGNRFRDVACIVFTTSKVTPVFDNLTAPLSGTYGDGISSLIAQLPIKSTNGVEGVWSTSYTSVLNAGTHNVPLTFTPYDADKYNVFSTKITVDIAAKDISDVAEVTVAGSFVYNGETHEPEVNVMIGETTLAKTTDYKVVYKNNTDAGEAKITVIGNGNYQGTATGTFKIAKKKLLSISSVAFSDEITAPMKEYDATTTVQNVTKVTFATSDNGVETQTFDVSGNMTVAATYADANAGTDKAYTITVSLGEMLAKNYELETDVSTLNDGVITKAPLTIKADDKVIIVGADEPTYTYTVEGLKGNDTAEEVFATVTVSAGENVDTSQKGTYTINIKRADLLSGNYVLNQPYETGTLTITKHEHKWSYTANDTDNTITATCSGDIGTCPNAGEVIISLEEPDDCIYSGTVKEAKVSLSKETEAFGVIEPSYTGVNLTDSNAINAGNYSASITVGDKSVSVDFEITPKSLTDANVQVNGTYAYDGKVIVPDVTVVSDDTTLTKDTDYTVAGKDINAGNAIVTVTGKGNYKDSVNQTFTIERKAITVKADTATKVYGSTDPVLTYTVDDSTPLVSGDVLTGTLHRTSGEDAADYDITQGTLTNANNKNYDITFVGSKFTITQKSMDNPLLTLSQNSFEYSGSAHTPSVTVKNGADVLVEGSDYTVNYEDNTAAGTAKTIVTLKADGNYIVNRTLSAEFAITKKKLTVVSAVAQDKEYDGTSAVNITSVVLSGIIGSELVETDLSNVTAELEKANVGTYTSVVLSDLTLTGTDSKNYELEAGKHTVSTAVEITAKPLAGAVTTIEEGTYIYKASEIEPKVTVVLNGKTLIHNTDYTVAYADNVNAGTATVTVIGCGNYKDTAAGTFTIGKAKVVLTAEDKTAFQGDDKPTPTYKVNGLLGNDKLITEPLMKYEETLDMDKVGTYGISVSDADAGQNYEIQYADGVLYVKKTGVEQILIKSEQNIISEVKGELLSIERLDTPEEIKEELTRVAMSENPGYNKKDIEHYEVTLKYSLDGGESWIEATKSNFPQGGIRIKLKYPNGTGKHTHDFVVTHMFTENSDKLGTVAGRTEQPPVTKLDDGLEVILNGLSPVSIAWKAIPMTPSKDDNSSSSDQGDQSISMFGDKNGTAEHERLTQTAITSQSTASGGLAPTGDTAQPVGLLLLAAAALTGVGGVKYYKKKKGQKKNYSF